MEELYRIESPYYVASIIVREGIVHTSAPIIHWMAGFTLEAVKAYCIKKNFVITKINET